MSCASWWSIGFLRREFLDNLPGALLADLAGGVIDAALGQSEFAAAGARFGVEFVEGSIALFRRKLGHIHAGENFGAVGVLQEDVALVLEGFDLGGDGKSE